MEGSLERVAETKGYLFENRTNVEAIVLNRLFNAKLADNTPKYTLYRADREVNSGGKIFPRGVSWLERQHHPYKRWRQWKHSRRSSAFHIYADESIDEQTFDRSFSKVTAPRLGLYKPWTANMDEGWTRWVLDTHEFTYNSLTNAEIQAGHLVDRYDAIILPDFGGLRHS